MNDAATGRDSGQTGTIPVEPRTARSSIAAGEPTPRLLHRGRLFRKYLLLVLSLVTGALLASGAISVYFTYQETTAALANLQQEKAVAAASRIEQYVQRIEQQLAFASLPQLGSTDVELRRIEFLKLLRQAPEVTDIAQLDPAGREQIAVSRLGMDTVGSGKDRSQDPAFRNAKRGQPWFGPVYFRKETEPYMTIALRSGGDAGPVTVADVNLKFIWDVVSRIKIGDKGKAYVVDGSGFLVADPDIGLVLRKTQLSSLPHVQAAISGQPRDDSTMLSTDLAGTKVLASVAPIETLGWKVFVEQPVAEVYAKLNASILRTGLLLLGGLVISALAAFALARGMARPIRTLDEGARRIGEGDLDQQIVVRTGDELEGLAAQFNRMTAQLKESYAGLERKVEARTAELQNSLEQQTAISEILRVISSSPTDVQPVLDAVAERAAHLCDAPYARIMLIDGDVLRPAAEFSIGPTPESRPVPLDRTSITGRAAVDCETVHIQDVVPLLDAEFPGAKSNIVRLGCRAVLAVPLMREGGAYGAIFLYRKEPRLFSADQVALVQTFARQAAIAIDNVRLFNETREALDQQRASGEVLAAISNSIADTAPVFEKILASCERLFAGNIVGLMLVRDGMLEIGAYHGPGREDMNKLYPVPLARDSASGIAILDQRLVNIADIEAPDVPPLARAASRFIDFRSIATAPMIFEGQGIGALWVARSFKGPFPDKQIGLLKTFADQAVIAIQNARLVNETKEALDQQRASGEVLAAISSSISDARPVFDVILKSCQRLFTGHVVGVTLIRDDGMLDVGANAGAGYDELKTIFPQPLNRETASGIAILDGRLVSYADVDSGEMPPKSQEGCHVLGAGSMAFAPMLFEGRSIGTLWVGRAFKGPFPDKQLALLKTFADQAVIAIQNARLFNETKEALDQQTAVSDMLRAISRTTFDLQPVLVTLIESAARLCRADKGFVYIREGGVYRMMVNFGSSPEQVDIRLLVPEYGTLVGRTALTRDVVRIDDAKADPTYAWKDAQEKLGFRSMLGVPMLREGEPIGVIAMWREEVRPFSPREIQLVTTFADQAVIAIENVRLFNETKEALDQQRASGEVLAAISSSIADTRPVFDVILGSCQRLFSGHNVGVMVVRDDGMLDVGAYIGPGRDELAKLVPATARPEQRRRHRDPRPFAAAVSRPRRRRRAVGAARRAAIVSATSRSSSPRCCSRTGRSARCGSGARSRAASRTSSSRCSRPSPNRPSIAIQNVRLFHEIEDKSRQLEIANKHKSEFLANMSHELRTPLNAIIGFSEVLLERLFGDLNDKQDDYLKDIHSSGKHLLGLINDILDLSKIEAGRMELERAAFDLPGALANALTLVRERAQRHGIALGLDVDPALGEIVADERKLKQILLNLLSNAVKFTPDGGHVDVIARREPGRVVIAVRDTGIGIAPEDQAAVFEEFRQVGTDYTRKQEGTGLGLALARRFVELHGGHLTLESALGKGSTFTFDIPITP